MEEKIQEILCEWALNTAKACIESDDYLDATSQSEQLYKELLQKLEIKLK